MLPWFKRGSVGDKMTKNKIVKTPYEKYKVTATSPIVKIGADVFSCSSQGCYRCGKLCEHGIAIREIFEY